MYCQSVSLIDAEFYHHRKLALYWIRPLVHPGQYQCSRFLSVQLLAWIQDLNIVGYLVDDLQWTEGVSPVGFAGTLSRCWHHRSWWPSLLSGWTGTRNTVLLLFLSFLAGRFQNTIVGNSYSSPLVYFVLHVMSYFVCSVLAFLLFNMKHWSSGFVVECTKMQVSLSSTSPFHRIQKTLYSCSEIVRVRMRVNKKLSSLLGSAILTCAGICIQLRLGGC